MKLYVHITLNQARGAFYTDQKASSPRSFKGGFQPLLRRARGDIAYVLKNIWLEVMAYRLSTAMTESQIFSHPVGPKLGNKYFII